VILSLTLALSHRERGSPLPLRRIRVRVIPRCEMS